MVDSINEKSPRGVSGSVSGSSGLQVFEYHQEKMPYRVCWCGPVGLRVYVAWYRIDARQWQCVGVFREGTEAERKAAAEQCCRDHWQKRKGVA